MVHPWCNCACLVLFFLDSPLTAYMRARPPVRTPDAAAEVSRHAVPTFQQSFLHRVLRLDPGMHDSWPYSSLGTQSHLPMLDWTGIMTWLIKPWHVWSWVQLGMTVLLVLELSLPQECLSGQGALLFVGPVTMVAYFYEMREHLVEGKRKFDMVWPVSLLQSTPTPIQKELAQPWRIESYNLLCVFKHLCKRDPGLQPVRVH